MCGHVYNAPAASVLEAVSFVLQRAVEANAKVKVSRPGRFTDGPFAFPWAGEWQPVHAFVNQLARRLRCGTEVFVAALCLLGRLEGTPLLPALTQVTVHRAFFACTLLALKLYDDDGGDARLPSFAHLAKLAHVSVADLKALELEAFKALSFRCHVSAADFTACHLRLRGFDTLRRRGVRNLGASASPTTLAHLCDCMLGTLNPTPLGPPLAVALEPLPLERLADPRLPKKRPATARGRPSDPRDKISKRLGLYFRPVPRSRSLPVPVAILVDD